MAEPFCGKGDIFTYYEEKIFIKKTEYNYSSDPFLPLVTSNIYDLQISLKGLEIYFKVTPDPLQNIKRIQP